MPNLERINERKNKSCKHACISRNMKYPPTTPIFLEGSKITILQEIALFRDKKVKTRSTFHFVYRYGYIDEFEA